MKLLIDADGCPVTDIAVRTAVKFGIECVIICDTAHSIVRVGARTITVDKGADSADLRLVNLVSAGDIAVTQDYGLAAMRRQDAWTWLVGSSSRQRSWMPYTMKISSNLRGMHSSSVSVFQSISVHSFLPIHGNARWCGRHRSTNFSISFGEKLI